MYLFGSLGDLSLFFQEVLLRRVHFGYYRQQWQSLKDEMCREVLGCGCSRTGAVSFISLGCHCSSCMSVQPCPSSFILVSHAVLWMELVNHDWAERSDHFFLHLSSCLKHALLVYNF
jgi:hypothetical protein